MPSPEEMSISHLTSISLTMSKAISCSGGVMSALGKTENGFAASRSVIVFLDVSNLLAKLSDNTLTHPPSVSIWEIDLVNGQSIKHLGIFCIKAAKQFKNISDNVKLKFYRILMQFIKNVKKLNLNLSV